jgi:hypothetical protein
LDSNRRKTTVNQIRNGKKNAMPASPTPSENRATAAETIAYAGLLLVMLFTWIVL